MWSTDTGPYRSVIGYVSEDNKLDLVRYEYKQGDSLNKVATHDYGPSNRSEIN